MFFNLPDNLSPSFKLGAVLLGFTLCVEQCMASTESGHEDNTNNLVGLMCECGLFIVDRAIIPFLEHTKVQAVNLSNTPICEQLCGL